jgi:hypothetical protein
MRVESWAGTPNGICHKEFFDEKYPYMADLKIT